MLRRAELDGPGLLLLKRFMAAVELCAGLVAVGQGPARVGSPRALRTALRWDTRRWGDFHGVRAKTSLLELRAGRLFLQLKPVVFPPLAGVLPGLMN